MGVIDNINGSPLRAGYTGCLGSLITQPIKPPSLERNGWQFKVCLSRLCISTFTHYFNLTVEAPPTTARGRCKHDLRNSRFSHFLSKGKDLTHYLVSKIPLIFLKWKESRLFTPWEAHDFCSAAPPGGHRCTRSQPLAVLGILKGGPSVLSSVSQSLDFPHRKATTLLKIYLSETSLAGSIEMNGETTQWKD